MSGDISKIVTEFAEWLVNDSPPRAAYRKIVAGRLNGLSKHPGVQPVGMGETWQRKMSKCVIKVAVEEVKEDCGKDQLYGGVEEGIDVGIHAMSLLCARHSHEEGWGFLLVDTHNTFNEENWTEMLWAVQFYWTSGAQFTFNCYCHWATLVVKNVDGSGHFFHSKEGATQGYPLAMISYGIGILPLICELCTAHPHVKQPWYVDDA